MNTVTITPIASGFAIVFPFGWKNKFRESFPSARWNPAEKRWEVGPRSSKRLEQWVEVMRPLMDADAAAERAEFDTVELERLREYAERLRREIEAARGDAAHAAEVAAALKHERERVDALKAELSAAKQEAANLAAQVKEALDGAIDMSAVQDAHREMCRWYGCVGADAREHWGGAQDVIRAAEAALAALGIASKGISKLARLNLNRPDRDRPNLVFESDIMAFHRLADA